MSNSPEKTPSDYAVAMANRRPTRGFARGPPSGGYGAAAERLRSSDEQRISNPRHFMYSTRYDLLPHVSEEARRQKPADKRLFGQQSLGIWRSGGDASDGRSRWR